jgi:Ca2+-binding EF-hand superfamily protein
MSISGLGGSPFAGTRGAFQPPSFGSLDTNKDGSITLDELEAAAPGGASATSKARADKLFSAMDANGDGSISTDEKSAFDQKVQSHHGGHHGGGGAGFLAQQLAGTSDASVFAATDTNGDGSVSLDEFSADPAAKSLSSSNVQQLFNLIDSNGDGSISQTESSEFLDKVRQAVGTADAGPPGPPPGGPGSAGSTDPLMQLLHSDPSKSTDGGSDNSASSSSTTNSTSSSSSSTGTSSALDLLLAAANAYSTGTQQPDLVSMLSNLLKAA